MPDNVQSNADRIVVHLEPLGLICGGPGTPLGETWMDLSSRNHVLYGLNGAGKTTVLDSLNGALLGRAGGGKILARIPFNNPNVGGYLGDALSLILTGQDTFGLDHPRDVFLDLQDEVLEHDFNRRQTWNDWDIPESRWDDLDWFGFLHDLSRSDLWLFTPTGTDGPKWSVSPVLLVSPQAKWAEHLAELELILPHDDGPIPHDLGLELLWWGSPPTGGPAGIIGSLLERSTAAIPQNPWWPFGRVVTDDLAQPQELTRRHIASHPTNRWGSQTPIVERGPALNGRIDDIARRANLALGDLLDDAPALHLSLGDDSAWFAGESCVWTATRYPGDTPIALERLSSAELRWASLAIQMALAEELALVYDRTRSADLGEHWQPADAFEGAVTTWLLLDEPERGLHRTAETQMARGLTRRTGAGLRSVLATHSPDLLDNGIGDVQFVRRRSHDRQGAVISMRDFDGAREDLGLNPSDMLRRTRGIALVEGEHDLRILTGTIGTELLRLGVEILPLRGASQLRTATDSRFLFEFTDAVLFPILDDLMLGPIMDLWERQTAAARVKPASEVTEELRRGLRKLVGKGSEFLEEFLSTSISFGTFERVQPLGIPQPDILECLPVRAFVPKAGSWQEVREAARRGNGGVDPSETKFKDFLRKANGADLSDENIEHVARTSPAHPDIKALLAAIDERLSD